MNKLSCHPDKYKSDAKASLFLFPGEAHNLFCRLGWKQEKLTAEPAKLLYFQRQM
jgi:hypothetical protein